MHGRGVWKPGEAHACATERADARSAVLKAKAEVRRRLGHVSLRQKQVYACALPACVNSLRPLFAVRMGSRASRATRDDL